MKFNIPRPALNYQLTEDFEVPVMQQRTTALYRALTGNTKLYWNDLKPMIERDEKQGMKMTIPAGTIFRLSPFSVRLNENPQYERLFHCRSISSPNPALAMKRYKGTSHGGVNFSLTKAEFESLEVEVVDVTV